MASHGFPRDCPISSEIGRGTKLRMAPKKRYCVPEATLGLRVTGPVLVKQV